jgi:hypothetical protein
MYLTVFKPEDSDDDVVAMGHGATDDEIPDDYYSTDEELDGDVSHLHSLGFGCAELMYFSADPGDEVLVEGPAQDGTGPFVIPFPMPSAGAALPEHHGQMHYNKYHGSLNDPDSVWAPFKSEIDWRVAEWAKLQGPSSTAVSELLSINGVRV